MGSLYTLVMCYQKCINKWDFVNSVLFSIGLHNHLEYFLVSEGLSKDGGPIALDFTVTSNSESLNKHLNAFGKIRT